MKPLEIHWLEGISQAHIDEAMEEACVDCHDEHEQLLGLSTMAGDEIAYPFKAAVLGEIVEVVGSASSTYDPLGLDLIVVREGKQYAIAAHSVELLKPLPDGHLYLAAYLRWKANQ